MARASLFVRPLTQGEMEFLAHLRKSRRQALRQRAQILMASMVYTPVNQIALICKTDEAHVRRVIHAFNEFGFDSLNPKSRHWSAASLQQMRPEPQPTLCGSRPNTSRTRGDTLGVTRLRVSVASSGSA
jgi:hypothetical protein